MICPGTEPSERSRHPPAPEFPRLSGESEIAAWVATGMSNNEIADALFLSPATVRTHVTRAMTKLNARSRAQFVVLAARAGLTVTP